MTAFDALSWWLIAYIVLVIGISGWVQGALGLGFPTIATPLIATVTSMQVAVVVVLIPCIASVLVNILRSTGFMDQCIDIELLHLAKIIHVFKDRIELVDRVDPIRLTTGLPSA